MGRRLFNGRAFSENGWPYVDTNSAMWTRIPGAEHVSLQIQEGEPFAIMRAWAADYHAFVEPLRDPDSACWTPGNSVATSNHPGGTAMDLNWQSHPFHARGTFNSAQMAVIREMREFYKHDGLYMIFWGGDWKSPIDEMHWQMGYGTYNQAADAPDPRVREFVARKIRPDGFSTFRRDPAPNVDAAPILSNAMGGRLSLERYRELLPAVRDSLLACDCTNVNRIAMWCAQIGHESGGLYYTEEIASGDAYEGRADLGNTQPGDGRRFKGRSWIQITGRSNYTRLSQWAHSKGLVSTPTFFVDNPAELAADRYAGLGAAWYWVVARPDINTLSDKRDLVTVTKRINGGTNGLADRQTRYDRALALGDQLLTLTQNGDDDMTPEQDRMLREVHGALFNKIPSQSKYKTEGEGARWQLHELIKNDDALLHETVVERQAMMGNPEALALVQREADKGDKWSQVVLNYINDGQVE